MNKKIYIAGEFHVTETILEVVNPYTNEVFAHTYLAGTKELEKAIEGALKVEKEMKFLPSFKKYEILMSIADKLSKKKQEIAKIISLESAKPIKFAISEVERSIQTFTIAAEESKRIFKEYISLDWTPAGQNREGLVKHFPIGLVAGISPFNFPLNLAVHKIAPAIAAGNPIILKPSRNTPLSTLMLAEIIDETDLPKGAISIIPMDRDSGNQLVTDCRFKLLSFTGSSAIGWKMKHDAGKKRVLLELGGNSGVIITETAEIDFAIERSIMGAFSYSGQVCIHAQRFFIHEKIYDEFVSKFIEKTKKLKLGNPLDFETDISSLIDKENTFRVSQWIEDAVNRGAKILLGGKVIDKIMQPTIITNSCNEMKICALEVFGPVVTIEKITNFEEGIEKINNTQYGLQCGVFTNNQNEVFQAFNNIETGGIIINDVPTFRVDNMPYGGIKDSGFGREGVKYSILEMTEPKLLVFTNKY